MGDSPISRPVQTEILHLQGVLVKHYNIIHTYLHLRVESLPDYQRHKDPNHEHGPDCAPPSEEELVKFLQGLSDEDFDKVCFLQSLHRRGYML